MLLPLASFCKDEPTALFEKGNAAYAKGNYPEAVKDYQQVVDGGYHSASVYFNLGNAYYKTGELAPAILYYEKARKLSPGDEDINFNIRLANSKTTDKVDEAPEFFIARWWHAFILSFSTGTLGVISVLLFLSGSAALIIYFFAAAINLKKAAFYSAVILFLIGSTTVFMANRQVNYFDAHRQAIVFNSSVTAKSSPTAQAGNLFVVHDGTKVNVLEENNGWMKVRLANGNEGWVLAGDIRVI